MSYDRERFDITDEAAWLAARAVDLTSTEVATLYGLNPYSTLYETWHRKKAGEAVQRTDTDRMKWGRRLEAVVALGVAEDLGWKAEPRKIYQRIPALRLGASFDFQAQQEPDGLIGLMEVKNVDRKVFDSQWQEVGDEYQAPAHIELQLQVQLMVSGLSWGAIVALVGGNDAKVLMRKAEPAICADIEAKVKAFWASIEAGTEPRPDFDRDGEYLRKNMIFVTEGKVLDADEQMQKDIETLIDAKAKMASYEKIVDGLQAKLLYAAGDAEKITSPLGSVKVRYTEPSPGKLVTPDMVGTYIGARAGYRQFRFYPKAK